MSARNRKGIVSAKEIRLDSYPSHSLLHDRASRERKLAKILAVLKRAVGADLSGLRCLDLGCASGLITHGLAPHVRWAVGLEYDPEYTRLMDASGVSNLLYVRGDACRLPMPDDSVALALCAQVYEHVLDAEAMAAEIYRVLRPGGHCFFSGPNRLDIIERHYGLPFVSWLPRPLADVYLRLAGRGDAYHERPRTYWGLRRLWRRFVIVDYTLEMVRHPLDYHCANELGGLAWVGKLPGWLLRALTPLFPNYNWVLCKMAGEPR